MKRSVLLLSAMTVGLPLTQAFADPDARALKQGRALATVLSFLMPGVGREVADKAASFWTAKKPSHLEIVESGDQQIILSYLPESGRLQIDRRQLDKKPLSVVIEPGPMGDMVAHNSEGRILLSAKTEKGTVSLIGPKGDLIAKVVPAYTEPSITSSGFRGLPLPLPAR